MPESEGQPSIFNFESLLPISELKQEALIITHTLIMLKSVQVLRLEAGIEDLLPRHLVLEVQRRHRFRFAHEKQHREEEDEYLHAWPAPNHLNEKRSNAECIAPGRGGKAKRQ